MVNLSNPLWTALLSQLTANPVRCLSCIKLVTSLSFNLRFMFSSCSKIETEQLLSRSHRIVYWAISWLLPVTNSPSPPPPPRPPRRTNAYLQPINSPLRNRVIYFLFLCGSSSICSHIWNLLQFYCLDAQRLGCCWNGNDVSTISADPDHRSEVTLEEDGRFEDPMCVSDGEISGSSSDVSEKKKTACRTTRQHKPKSDNVLLKKRLA